MTLLNEGNLASITERIPGLDERYRNITGKSLYEIGCHAAGTAQHPSAELKALKVASIPVTAGGGLIGNFADIVALILRHFVGVDAYTTERTDVSGFEDALLENADIVFLADDETCMAYNTRTRRYSHNSDATGRAFASLLELASGRIDDEVLVLGMGKVGAAAYRFLVERGCSVRWYDPKPDIPADIDTRTRCEHWQEQTWNYLVDATYAPAFIGTRQLTERSIVAAPGIPFGLRADAVDKAGLVIHDELESGIVTMLCEVM